MCSSDLDGDFPVTDRHAREMITLPLDQYLRTDQLDEVISVVRSFYVKSNSKH